MSNTAVESDYTFTHSKEDIDSSAVESVFYNSYEKTLLVALRENEQAYLYTGVPYWVFNSFVTDSSVGRFYATKIKRDYGPGATMGYTEDLAISKATNPGGLVSSASPKTSVGTPKGLTYAQGAQRPAAPSATASGGQISSMPLSFPAATARAAKRRYEVIFDSNGERAFDAKADSVDGAVAELKEIGSMLGVTFTVKRVLVHFE